jgi:hypothetical protein
MQPLCEHEDEAFEEIADKDKPVQGVCFWVLTEFNIAHRAVKRRFKEPTEAVIDPDSFATFSEAMEIADEYAIEIRSRFRNSAIQRISDDIRDDEFHLYVVDRMNVPIAKIGVIGEDYRKQTIN